MVTLLLVDKPLVRRGLRMWFDRAADITVIGEASNEAEAVVLAQALHPNVVLMNIPMLTADGIAAAAVLCASVPHCAVVLLSFHDDALMWARARAAGAAILVGKQEGVKALLGAIREAGGRGRVSPRA